MIYQSVKEWCEDNNITIAALERMAGFGNGTISSWENSAPRVESLQKLSAATGIDVEFWIKKMISA